jgi:NADPH-dependent curcumin reductase CurA
VDWLLGTLAIDAAINYREADDLTAELGKHAPAGIDVYFDNVGGDHLEAALTHMNPFGRVICCGMISLYNATAPVAAPRNLTTIVGKRLLLKGFIISDHMDQRARFQSDMSNWLSSGEIRWEETVFDGIENAPKAFMGLFKGENLGKMLVKLD